MPVTLLVEGKDDRAVVAKIIDLRQLGPCRSLRVNASVAEGFHIVRPDDDDLGGDLWTLSQIEPIVKTSTKGPIGIIIDADVDPQRRWLQVRSKLMSIDRPVLFRNLPERFPTHDPFLASADGRIVGLWLMPDNTSPGKLETFLASIRDPGAPNWELAGSVLETVATPRFKDSDREKAQLSTWLAWQDPPGNQFGTAIEAGAFHIQHEAANAFVAWLQRLKDLDT